MLRGEAEGLGAEIIAGYKEDAMHYQEMQRTGTVPEEFLVKVKTTSAVQKVSEMEAMDHLEATERAHATVEETGMTVQVRVPEGAVGGQQVPCQANPGMPAHMITIPLGAKAGDTIDVKLPKLEDLSEERLEQFVAMLSEAVDAGSKHPQLIGCLAKRAMHYLLLGKLTESLTDLGNLLAVTEHKPVNEDPTAAEAYIMSGFVHRLCVMKCAMPPSKEAVIHEQKATAAFAKATKLGVDNLQESITTMEGEIQRAPKVRAIVEHYSAATAHMQKAMNAAAGGKGAAGSPPGSPKKAKAEAKAAIKAGSEAFDNEDYKQAIQHFTTALEKNPSEKLTKWLYKNRAVCYKYTKKYEEMLADASESCKLEPTVPEHYLRCAAALKQLGRVSAMPPIGRRAPFAEVQGCVQVEELRAVCTRASALRMPPKLKEQLRALSPAAEEESKSEVLEVMAFLDARGLSEYHELFLSPKAGRCKNLREVTMRMNTKNRIRMASRKLPAFKAMTIEQCEQVAAAVMKK
eukprot:COSAG04_NODE_1835_length_5442_cov_19.996631_2_plen_517_part_00